METEMTLLKQFTRKQNIEIKGMPQEPKESLTEIVQTIAEKVEVQLEPSDIDVVHRVPTKKLTKTNIIVRFVSRSARNKLLQAAKKKRLTTSDFGFADAGPAYINEHLCHEYKALLGKAIAKKKGKEVEVRMGCRVENTSQEDGKFQRSSHCHTGRLSQNSMNHPSNLNRKPTQLWRALAAKF
ncbi:hypothetical protein HPB48_002200 [Haemaphysalis longicornis]|uniref:FP protein N-terminal domain-containing protein n=1 Tax=Haemaphysalis longicornis TaxID=44386 RepID=A0A9J6F7S2_HAELO|nr:hypothetical protein HPB48_002200 [Haemaphysalis longicornis]